MTGRQQGPGSESRAGSTIDPANEIRLTGELVGRETLRYTPAGIPILDARLAHRSEVTQAGQRRQVEFDIALSFSGPAAQRADGLRLGQAIAAFGFLAPRRKLSKTLVLHVTRFAELEPTSN
ncbi:primosomal replication protein N [Burkholderiaceae bacterium FT117]|uniref:primosomal replication protein N n=1 Tax=Zeimonas sediminis TaxID=2944268 RepID=UPI002342D344|nr:primosomal replication protein N [Zeimonas sediminis]MCM5572131.1 primosomal replication protein N [Zeimonas sediminis]